jgi:predicted NAD/FAD-binding protein
MVRFCHNHGLIQVTGRPQWWTVAGGARHYVEDRRAHRRQAPRIVPCCASSAMPMACITSRHQGRTRVETFDKLVLATHSDQALALLDQPTRAEQETLGAIRYHPNRAVLHTDASVLPRHRTAWAAWNYERGAVGRQHGGPRVCLHYLINRLQPLPWTQPVVVSLNPIREIPRSLTMGSYDYTHPVFDMAAIRAQAACRNSRASSTPIFAAPGWATAFTKTA